MDTEEQKKICQVSSKDQNVAGRDTSKINRVPPIGEPNAAETPAAAPAQANSRLLCSLRNFFKKPKGMKETYNTVALEMCDGITIRSVSNFRNKANVIFS